MSPTTERFIAQRLTLARELSGLSKTELAERIGKTAGALSHFEGGRAQPDPTTLATLALALGMPREYFCLPLRAARLGLDDCNFRSLRSASQRERRQLLAFGTQLSEVEAVLSEYVELPDVQLTPRPLVEGERCEDRALEVRKSWGLGVGPIHEVTRLLETRGIVVAYIPRSCERVAAFSCWQRARPFVFIVAEQPPSRERFDAAHELGHLALHVDVTPGDRALEADADRFAAAFLMPRDGILPHLVHSRPTLDGFWSLKRHWGVSAAALIRRAFDLGVIREATYRRLQIELSVGQHRRNEPYEFAASPPSLLVQAAAQCVNVTNILMRTLRLRESHLKALLSGQLSMNEHRGDESDDGPPSST